MIIDKAFANILAKELTSLVQREFSNADNSNDTHKEISARIRTYLYEKYDLSVKDCQGIFRVCSDSWYGRITAIEVQVSKIGLPSF